MVSFYRAIKAMKGAMHVQHLIVYGTEAFNKQVLSPPAL